EPGTARQERRNRKGVLLLGERDSTDAIGSAMPGGVPTPLTGEPWRRRDPVSPERAGAASPPRRRGLVGEPWVPPRLKNAYAADRPVADAGDADHAVAGLDSPDARVLGDAPVVAQHQVVAGGDLRAGEVGRLLAVRVGLVQPHGLLARVLHPDVAALRPHRLAGEADDPLHERGAREAAPQAELGRCADAGGVVVPGLAVRRVEDDDLAPAGTREVEA